MRPTQQGFRHTAASHAIAAGESAEEVSWQLGHRNSLVTRAVYVHELKTAERTARRRQRMKDVRPVPVLDRHSMIRATAAPDAPPALVAATQAVRRPIGGVDPDVAAAFLSAAAVKPGTYNVGGVLVAILFLAALNSGLNLAGAQPEVNDYVNGALIVGVGLAVSLGRRRSAA